jgi:hypothetical protein
MHGENTYPDVVRHCSLGNVVVSIRSKTVLVPSMGELPVTIHSIHHPPHTYLFAWVWDMIDLLDLVSKDKWVRTTQLVHVFDFNHAIFSFSSTMIGIKLITIEEHYFKILIPNIVILDCVFNDPVVLRFVSFCINDPHNNSCISSGYQRARSFKNY